MEQDRAPDVLPHHPELAGSAVDQPGGGGELDRQHPNEHRGGDPFGTEREHGPDRDQGEGHRTRSGTFEEEPISRRMELHNLTKELKRSGYFLTPPKGLG